MGCLVALARFVSQLGERGLPRYKLLKKSNSLCWTDVDISYAAPQAHGIVNIALHREYSPGIIFIFS
jgi:hypothetical protein